MVCALVIIELGNPYVENGATVIDDASAYEDCAYVDIREGETDEQRERRIDALVHGMVAAYGSQGILSLSYDPAERQQGMTALESEWGLLKRVAANERA